MKLILLLVLFISTLFAFVASIGSKSNLNSNASNSETDTLILGGSGSFAHSLSAAGDINGDGFGDIIVGANTDGLYGAFTGAAYIYFGSSNMDNNWDLRLSGQTSYSNFGESVSSAGDVNGDGFDDVIVGAHIHSNYRGTIYIFHGSPNMDNVPDFIKTGYSSQSQFQLGRSVAGNCDINADGFSDVVIGHSNGALVFLGGSVMDTAVDFRVRRNAGIDGFGSKVSTGGDLNSDGFSDFVVTSPRYNNDRGAVYVYFGGTVLDTISDVVLTGESTNSQFGYSVDLAGDINADGFSDLIVGAQEYNSSNGRVYIYFGGESVNSVPDVILNGELSGSSFGYSVSYAGDINGDGYSDILVGAQGYSAAKGKAYLFLGGQNMNSIPDFTLDGNEVPGASLGNSVSNVNDVDADGSDDFIIGEKNYNSNGRAHLVLNYIPSIRLLYPLNNSTNLPLSINFSWARRDKVKNYNFVLSTDSTFTNSIVNDTIGIDTFRTISDFDKDSLYYWRISAVDSLGNLYFSPTWKFRTMPAIKVNLKMLFEGSYYPLFSQLSRRDTVTSYLRESVAPYSKIDSAISVIDSLSFTGLFTFQNAVPGTYYIQVNHFSSIETWSRLGGDTLTNNGQIYLYDFTTAASKAYGNNLKRKGTKYCLYSGDVNQDGIIDISDLSAIDNDAYVFITGYTSTDLTGDGFVDITDLAIADNNASNFIGSIMP
jgi:hypothetical protein